MSALAAHVESLPLSLDESSRLAQLESVVEAGKNTFLEVGSALREIQEQRLYRATHATFEDYLREKVGFSRQHAYKLIQLVEVRDAVRDVLPEPTQAQLRVLSAVAEDDLADVARSVVDKVGPDASAAEMKAAVAKARPAVDPEERERAKAAREDAKERAAIRAEDEGEVEDVAGEEETPAEALERDFAAFLERCPARRYLDDRCRAIFDADARLWFEMDRDERDDAGKMTEPGVRTLAKRLLSSTEKARGYATPAGPFTWRLSKVTRTPGPDDPKSPWAACMTCGSTGRINNQNCGDCKGVGYRVSG